MSSEHLQEALSVLSQALPQISFDPNQPIAFTRAVVKHLQDQKQQHEADLKVMNERMTESIDRMLWRITELRNELRALQSEHRAMALPDTLKFSPIGILRPLSVAGPVPDGCVRVFGNWYKTETRWALTVRRWGMDTHFADIRLPKEEVA